MTSLNFADIRDLKIFTTISKINYTSYNLPYNLQYNLPYNLQYNLPYNAMFFPTHFSFLLLISKGITSRDLLDSQTSKASGQMQASDT
jgi:hypothetical protein